LLSNASILPVSCVENGKELIRVALSEKPWLIIPDNDMPDVDGIIAIAEIRKLLPDVKVIMMSARSNLGCSDLVLIKGQDEAISGLSRLIQQVIG